MFGLSLDLFSNFKLLRSFALLISLNNELNRGTWLTTKSFTLDPIMHVCSVEYNVLLKLFYAESSMEWQNMRIELKRVITLTCAAHWMTCTKFNFLIVDRQPSTHKGRSTHLCNRLLLSSSEHIAILCYGQEFHTSLIYLLTWNLLTLLITLCLLL